MSSIKESVGYALAQACKTHRQSIDSALKEMARHGCGELHVGQEMILLHLWGEEGLTQTQLAERLGVEPPTVTKMLQRMETAGLLRRCSDTGDARVSRVHLTERGRALEPLVERRWAAVEERVIAGMTAEERMLLRRLLQQVRANLAGREG
jgi:MarR family transcriptional regulator, organic hydroperoxide resistance regulator